MTGHKPDHDAAQAARAWRARHAAIAVARHLKERPPGKRHTAAEHAVLLTQLMNKLGMPATAMGGYAAWRMGQGADDVLVYHPVASLLGRKEKTAHAWVESGGLVIDASAWQLPKAILRVLGRGGARTPTEWSDEVLVARKCDARSLSSLIAGYGFGFYVERVRDLEPEVFDQCELSAEDLAEVRRRILHPDGARQPETSGPIAAECGNRGSEQIGNTNKTELSK